MSLRPLKDSDAEALFAAADASRRELERRFSWAESARGVNDEKAFLRGRAAVERQKTLGIFEAKTGELSGVMSLDESLKNPGLWRLSGWIKAGRQSRGYACEAARLAINGLDAPKNWHKVFALIDPANRPARRVLQKLGFRYEGCLRSHKRLKRRWSDRECWGLLRLEWKGRS